jgi:hypothetical protein
MRTGPRSFARLSIASAAWAVACVLLGGVNHAKADVIVGVDPTQNWIGYMNVFELPSNGGGYDFGSDWATSALPATFSGSVATLAPNINIDQTDPIDSYWWQPPNDGTTPGNHIMAASFYVENDPGPGSLSGQTVTFTGDVLSNTLVSPYTSVAFIDDFTPSYSLVNTITTPLVPGDFSINLYINPGDVLQYGFITTGPNARVAAEPGLGNVQVTAVPEPVTLGVLGAIAIPLLARRRRA